MANPNSKSAKKSSMFAGIDFGDEPSLSNTSETNNNKEDEKANPITLNTSEGKEVKAEIQKNIETANNSDKKLNKKQRKPYHEDYYLLYGGKDMPSSIKAKELLDFLKANGYGNSSLKQARESKNIAQIIADSFVPNKKNTRYCDFCGDEISGIEYETLKDGRCRCMTCARTAIKSTDEFREIFDEVKRNMEYFYGININADIKIEVLGPKEINKKAKKSFLHIKTIDKVVKVATVKNKNSYTLLFENGMPRLQTMLKIVCELTHVWQDLNWNYKNISKKYGALTDEVYYGMSKWAEIQYAFLINEPVVANKEEIITLSLNSARSKGYRRFKVNYPITEETVLFGPTPFIDKDYPLSFDYCGEIVEDNDKQENQINNTKEPE
jgi:hypothetical protein